MTIIVRSEYRPGGHAYYRMPEGVDPRRVWSARLRFRYLVPAGRSHLLGVTAQRWQLNDATIMEDGGVLVVISNAGISSFPGVFGFEETPELLAIIGAK